ncbi:MAG: YebC/PmpR family DNA-binding transcriptional regulator [bacterium]
MSGHSHAKTIQHKKAITDAKRGKTFSKLSREISLAAKEKGGNTENNPALRLVIEKARGFNMPKENIERAIKKGTGELAGENLESVSFEAYGPGGVAIIIEGITDNKNRTLGEVKQILGQYNAKLGGEGSAKWAFERKLKEDGSGSLEWAAKQEINVSEKDKEACEKLFEALDENDSVQEIYTNLKI